VQFTQSGAGFRILDKSKIVGSVLAPRAKQFTNFQRQLNLHGFVKSNGHYKNPLFTRSGENLRRIKMSYSGGVSSVGSSNKSDSRLNGENSSSSSSGSSSMKVSNSSSSVSSSNKSGSSLNGKEGSASSSASSSVSSDDKSSAAALLMLRRPKPKEDIDIELQLSSPMSILENEQVVTGAHQAQLALEREGTDLDGFLIQQLNRLWRNYMQDVIALVLEPAKM
jgi:HSF-type DNA-binding